MKQLFRAVVYLAFIAFLTFDWILTFDTVLRYVVILPSLVSIAFFLLGSKLRAVEFISAAWLVIGTLTVLSFFAVETFQASLGLVLLTVGVIFFYDFTRFSYKLDFSKVESEEKRLVHSYFSRVAETLALTITISLLVSFLSSRIISIQVLSYYSIVLVSFLVILSFAMIRIYSSDYHNPHNQ